MKTAAKPKVVKSTGLIFKPSMIRAFLRTENPKSQTRRLFRVQPPPNIPPGYYLDAYNGGPYWCWWTPENRVANSLPGIKCPFGRVGDLIYAKETYYDRADYARIAELRPDRIVYFADEQQSGWLKHSAMFMPKRYARIHRVITNIRVEPVNLISVEDAMAEGLSRLSKDDGRTWKWGIPDRDGLPGNDDDGWHWKDWEVDPRQAYRTLWDSIAGTESFDSGHWVWALTMAPITTGAKTQ